MYGGFDVYGPKTDLWEFDLIFKKWIFLEFFHFLSTRAYSTYTHGVIDSNQVIVVVGGKDSFTEYKDLSM